MPVLIRTRESGGPWARRAAGSPYTHTRMQALAYELWLTNLMGQRLIEIVTTMSWRGGELNGEDERALNAVKSFWAIP